MPDTQRLITYAEAIREATVLCLQSDTGVYVVGEGVTDPKAIFGTTRDLLDMFGPDRIIEMPVAENGLTGIAIGSAMIGQRPIMVHQRVDFALLALEQIFNNAAKMHYVSNGAYKVPILIRLIIGRGWGQGPQHAQSLESMFALVPGLKVIMPVTAYDAKGMTIAAIEDNNPVISIEHRWLHNTNSHVPEGSYRVPLGASRLARQGSDITIVATSYMVLESLLAAEALAEIGIEVDLIDLRTLRPLDIDPVCASVMRTGRLLTIDTGSRFLGIGAEIVAEVTERQLHSLVAAPLRLGLPDHPAPSSRALIPDFYPQPEQILHAALELCGVPEDRQKQAHAALANRTTGRLIDAPDASFTGPF